ncbi:unnamed protein product [Auanema sp. JU1783]|nr:unnamed protein product [Auanema sp. JU1783]
MKPKQQRQQEHSSDNNNTGNQDKKESEQPKAPSPLRPRKHKDAADRTQADSPNPNQKKQKKPSVQAWVQRALDMGVQNLVKEFQMLAKWIPDNMTCDEFLKNREFNRYQDVPCQDDRRIVLNWPGVDNDYIHANFVATPNSDKRFICTQGPLEGTQFAFWIMVVQEEVESIIMLCNTMECGKIKCHQYYPLEKNTSRVFGEGDSAIMVTTIDIKNLSAEDPFVRVSRFIVHWKNRSGENQSRMISHYQWENWPDRGVPPTNLTAVNVLSHVRGSTKPILVHCSAGIGRTGTIVAIAYVQEKMQAGLNCMDMNDLLKELRSQRPYSIQNEYQYIYVHRVLLAYFLERYADRHSSCLQGENSEKYKKWVEDYKLLTST